MKFSKHLKYYNGRLIPKNKKSKDKLRKYKVSFYYLEPDRFETLKFAQEIHKEGTILMDPIEICQLAMLVRNTSKIEGDIAEIGVFKGGSAKVICQYKNDRELHLIDTFEGLPKTSSVDRNEVNNVSYAKGQYKADIARVKKYLQQYSNVKIYKRKFPENSKDLEGKNFSFVHLDLDLYQSTYDCLQFFYYRMSKGGVILTHDYQNAFGVRKAFDTFFADKPEIIIELACSQAIVVKI